MGEARLSLRHVSVEFGGVKAVSDVSATFGDEAIVAIIGANGAGKSTLANVVSGLVTMSSGSVLYNGQDLGKRNASARARLGIARAFQHPKFLSALTVEENLCLGVLGRGTARKRLKPLLERLSLGGWLEQAIGDVPYGVRKMLDVARAVIMEPDLLLCDEPLSGLDEHGRDRMIELLKSLAETHLRLVVIEHDIARMAQVADRVVVMEGGCKIADGPTKLVFTDVGVRRTFFEREDRALLRPRSVGGLDGAP